MLKRQECRLDGGCRQSARDLNKIMLRYRHSDATFPSECMAAWEYMRDFRKDPKTKELYYKGEKA